MIEQNPNVQLHHYKEALLSYKTRDTSVGNDLDHWGPIAERHSYRETRKKLVRRSGVFVASLGGVLLRAEAIHP
jgi:hypothetical protein